MVNILPWAAVKVSLIVGSASPHIALPVGHGKVAGVVAEGIRLQATIGREALEGRG